MRGGQPHEQRVQVSSFKGLDSLNTSKESMRAPNREPLRETLVRTGIIALVIGAVLAQWLGGLTRWPLTTLMVLWPSFGGHWVELWFLNWLRPRLSARQAVQMGARLGVWFAAGIGLAFGMHVTAIALSRYPPAKWPAWWLGGLGFIGIELVAHLILHVCRRPSFYNGRG
jgi:hypothetical protein